MNCRSTTNQKPTSSFTPIPIGLLQRKGISYSQHSIDNEKSTERTNLTQNNLNSIAHIPNRTASSLTSSASFGRLQRQAAPKEKTNQEKYQEGLEKLGEAFLKTPLGQELLEKIKQDALVKGATQLGKDFISTWTGKIVTGAAATGAVTALAATHKELPAQIPEIPLDVLTPGLSVRLTYKGPVDRPTEATISFKFTEQAPKDPSGKKPLSAADKFRAETARLTAENEKFRASMHYKPGSPEDLQQKAEQEAIRSVALKYSGGLDIAAIPLATPQPKNGLQLTMPKPSLGIQPPSLLGDEFKLKPPTEQKRKEDEPTLQKQLSIGASNDPLELEADRIADRVMAASPNSVVSSAPPRIQRFTGQTTEQADMAAPASVDSVLSSPGSPLEPTLQQDMGQRFGHDFSHVRVHTDAAAARSVRDVDANAYTVGRNIVFGAGQFTPETHEGKRLIAHELTHVVQQSASDRTTHISNPIIRRQAPSGSNSTANVTSTPNSKTRTEFEATMRKRFGVTKIITGTQQKQESYLNIRNGAPKIGIPNWQSWDPGSDSPVYESIIQGLEAFNWGIGGVPSVTEILFFEMDYELSQTGAPIAQPSVGASFGAGQLTIYRASTKLGAEALPISRSNTQGTYPSVGASVSSPGSSLGAPRPLPSQDQSIQRVIGHELGHGLIEAALAVEPTMIKDYQREVGWTSGNSPQLFDVGVPVVSAALVANKIPPANYEITPSLWNSPQWVEQPISHYSVDGGPGEDFAEAVMTFIHEPNLLLDRSPHRFRFLNSRKDKWLPGLIKIPQIGDFPQPQRDRAVV